MNFLVSSGNISFSVRLKALKKIYLHIYFGYYFPKYYLACERPIPDIKKLDEGGTFEERLIMSPWFGASDRLHI